MNGCVGYCTCETDVAKTRVQSRVNAVHESIDQHGVEKPRELAVW
jgi:hypothetical protein